MEEILIEQFIMQNPWVIFLILLWTLPWKGVALWKAVKNSHKKWFVAILIVNSFAILEILYIFCFSRKKQKHPEA